MTSPGSELHVEIVSVERRIWSGEATSVVAKTTEGEVGVLPGHAPLLGQVAEGGTVRVLLTGGERITAAVHGGFLSVTEQGVTVLAEVAELSGDIDRSRAESALSRAQESGDLSAERRASGRLRATEVAS